jgi:nucleoside-diphosphate-sugar epimerase
MRLLLIGASGYLGARVHRAAVAAGIDVVTVGRGRAAAGERHLVLDLAAAGPAVVAAAIAAVDPDVVVNCAGATSGDLATLTAANIDAPANLVAALLSVRSTARLVHLGSAAEYGRGPAGPVREDEPARPLSPYGVTKLAGTRLVELGRTAGLPATVLRVFNPVGPGAPAHTLPGRAASELARAIRANDAARMDGPAVARMDGPAVARMDVPGVAHPDGPAVVRLGGLDAVRDFVDIDDVAGAVLAAATGPVPAQGVLNVGSGTAVSARELVGTLVDVAGARVRIEEGGGASARSADVPWQQADIAAATAAWGWRPSTPLAVSLAGLWRQAS